MTDRQTPSHITAPGPLPLLRLNAAENEPRIRDAGGEVTVQQLGWGCEDDIASAVASLDQWGGVDYVVGSDLSYDPTTLGQLFDTIAQVLSREIQCRPSKPAPMAMLAVDDRRAMYCQ